MGEEIIDLNEVLERVEGDKELLIELIEIFSEDYPGKIEAIKEAVKNNDSTEVKNIAHSLKGASANISAKGVSSIFLEMEDKARNNDLSNIGEFLKQLDGLIENLRDFSAKLKEN